jgi:tetratricopeptide (TPR) repeat protein
MFVEVARCKPNYPSLRAAGRQAAAVAYASIGRADKAYRFFHNVSGARVDITRRLLICLGYTYYSQGNSAESIRIFREALKRWPKHRQRCRWAIAVLDAALRSKSRRAQVKAVRLLGKTAAELGKQLGRRDATARSCRRRYRSLFKR